jgi:hypothetical protein
MDGNPMYRLTKRLSLLKPKLKSLHRKHTSHIFNQVVQAKTNWVEAQILLYGSPQSKEY